MLNQLVISGYTPSKLCSDGSLERYKARLVVLGNRQEYGVDYDETFSTVAKMTTIRILLALAASHSWPLRHMDVKNAFLHSELSEDIYMKLPASMLIPFPTVVCKLNKSLYGLKQSMCDSFEKFRSTLLEFSFQQSNYDASLFLHKS